MIINVLEYLEAAADECPEKRALADENDSYTYAELRDKARRIGSYIAKYKKKPDGAAAVLIGRNAKSVIAFLGAVYAGCFYVPVDISFPEDRQRLMISEISPEVIINASDRKDLIFDSIDFDEIVKTKPDNDRIDSLMENHTDIDPLYAIFTSGSTGKPKCVLVSHRSVIDLVEVFADTFGFNSDMVFGNQAPFDFDVSVKDIYNAIRNKATIEIIPKKLFMMPKKLVNYLNERKVTALIWAVSALRIIADFKALDSVKMETVKYIMFSGEKMPVKALDYLMDNLDGVRFVNLYGPTEITCNCTYYEVRKRPEAGDLLPIGKAFRNSQVILLSENGEIIRDKGIEGEICVSGSCLALGYLSEPEKTAEKFVQSPYTSRFSRLIYKTGDMAYYNSDYDLVFTSRKDFQIKHMGHRIELEGIESIVNSLDGISYGCCVFDEKNGLVYLFYQGETKSPGEFANEFKKKLPKYMWPNRYVHLDGLPLNKNGKVDRKLLRQKYIEKKI